MVTCYHFVTIFGNTLPFMATRYHFVTTLGNMLPFCYHFVTILLPLLVTCYPFVIIFVNMLPFGSMLPFQWMHINWSNLLNNCNLTLHSLAWYAFIQ